MNAEAVKFYAKKFFPHLREEYGILCVIAILKSENSRARS